MATIESLTTVFVVSVTVLAFFTTSAANRIEEMDDPNFQMVGTLTLVSSYCLLFLLGAIVIATEEITSNEPLFAALKVVFAAFIAPTLILLFDHMSIMQEAWNHPEFSLRKTLLGAGGIILIYLMFLQMQPV